MSDDAADIPKGPDPKRHIVVAGLADEPVMTLMMSVTAFTSQWEHIGGVKSRRIPGLGSEAHSGDGSEASGNELDHSDIDPERALQARGLGRTIDALAHEQRAVEFALDTAFALHAAEPDDEPRRRVEDDWLRRFFRYVSDVDDTTILEIFAQALNEAALKKRTLLSPKALDTLRFFDLETLKMFEFCADHIGAFDSLPRGFLERHAYNRGVELDLPLMIEMDLVKTETQSHYLAIIGGFKMSLNYDPTSRDEVSLVRLTHVGRCIAALKKPEHRLLGDPQEFKGASQELLRLQEALALDAKVAATLGRSIVAELANAQSLDLHIRLEGKQVQRSKKAGHGDGFGLDWACPLAALGECNAAYVRAFLDEFADFDTNQAGQLWDRSAIAREEDVEADDEDGYKPC